VNKLNILINKSKNLSFARIPLRTSAENPEDLDKGMVVIGGVKVKNIEQVIELLKRM